MPGLADLTDYLRFGCGFSSDGLYRRLAGVTSAHTRLRWLHVLGALGRRAWNGPVLEFGSGPGYLLLTLARRWPACRFEGWDIDQRHLAESSARAAAAGLTNVSFHSCLEHWPKPAEPFGLVISVDVLEHVPDDAGCLRGLADLLSPGGRCLVHVPKRRSRQRRFLPFFSTHSDSGHVREEYTAEELETLAAGAGLKTLSIEETFGPAGELAFELNSLAWRSPALDRLVRLATLPVVLPLGLADAAWSRPWGNSLLLDAWRPKP